MDRSAIEEILGSGKTRFVEINAKDAQKRGIGDNELIKVLSQRGEIVARARVTDVLPPGVISMTFHFAESPVNILTSRAVDPITKIP